MPHKHLKVTSVYSESGLVGCNLEVLDRVLGSCILACASHKLHILPGPNGSKVTGGESCAAKTPEARQSSQ